MKRVFEVKSTEDEADEIAYLEKVVRSNDKRIKKNEEYRLQVKALKEERSIL